MIPDPLRPRPSRFPRALLPVPIALCLTGLVACERKHDLLGDLPTQCAVAPTSVDFGSVAIGDSADRTFTVTNQGSEALNGSVSEACGEYTLVGTPDFALGPAESRSFTLRFKPSAVGPRPCTISIGGCSALPASGQGLTPAASCGLSTTTLDFGAVLVGATGDAGFTITNTGGATLSGTVQESCPEFSLVGGGNYDLAPTEQATFTVRFAPTTSGAKNCTIDTGALCADVSASGTGQTPAQPACEVSTSALAFGTVTTGQSATRTFTIENVGQGTLSGTVSESCPEFSIVGGATYSLGAGQSATFTVRFAPTTSGAKNCTIDTGTLCADVSASGTGQAPAVPICQVSTTSLAFGTVTTGQSATRTFTIENVGQGTLSGTVSENCPDFSIVGGATYSLGAGQSATFTVSFAPSSGGTKNCTIDTGGGCADVSASGTGQAPPECTVSTTSLAFGTVTTGQSATRTFNIKNDGQGTLSGTVSESCPEFSIVGSPTYSLGAGQSATFTVSFAPLTPGAKNCTIDTGGDCADVNAAGTGELPLPICQLSATSIAFGDVSVGQFADRQLVVTNSGLGTLSGTLSESCPDVSIEGSASYSLGPLESATFTLRFTPSALGALDCTLDAGGSCGTVSLGGSGVPPPQCELSATTFDFGEVKVGRHEDRTFDVRNVGGGQLCGAPSESCDGFSILSATTYCAVPGTPYKLRVRFMPTREGPFECIVDPGAGCSAITVRGVGVPDLAGN